MEAKEYEARLSKLREEIDAIDGELLPLFLRRMGCSAQVAQLKGRRACPYSAPSGSRPFWTKCGPRGERTATPRRRCTAPSWPSAGPSSICCSTAGRPSASWRPPLPARCPWRAPGWCAQGVPGAFSHKAALEFFGGHLPRFRAHLKRPLRRWPPARRITPCCRWKTPPPGLSPGCMTSSSATGFTLWAPWT